MIGFIELLLERGKPFLLIKFGVSMCGQANNLYEVVTLGGNKLRYLSISRMEAVEAIRRFDLPLLYEMDNRNMIWGDERFRNKYRKMKCVCEEEI